MLAKVLSIAVVTTCVSSVASAAIISVDDPLFGGVGGGGLTRDTDQGLDFLDVTLSNNRSYDDVSSQFGTGGDFAGFRYATELEVIALVNNWGFSPGALPGQAIAADISTDQLSGLVNLLGVNVDTIGGHRSAGLTGTFIGSNSVRLIQIQDALVHGQFNKDSVVATQFITTDREIGTVASFLVKTTVIPEPSSLVLLTIGAVGLIGYGWRRKRKQ